MDLGFLLNLFDGVIVAGAALPSIYMATKVAQPKLRTLTVLLGVFLLIHGLFHLSYALADLTGFPVLSTLGSLLFEPLGYLLFLLFAVQFARSTA